MHICSIQKFLNGGYEKSQKDFDKLTEADDGCFQQLGYFYSVYQIVLSLDSGFWILTSNHMLLVCIEFMGSARVY